MRRQLIEEWLRVHFAYRNRIGTFQFGEGKAISPFSRRHPLGRQGVSPQGQDASPHLSLQGMAATGGAGVLGRFCSAQKGMHARPPTYLKECWQVHRVAMERDARLLIFYRLITALPTLLALPKST